MVRRMDRQGDVLIWCRKCSSHARQRMGPKLMICCKPEHVGTKEHGKIWKRIKVLDARRIWPRKRGTGRSKEKKKRLQR